MRRRLHPGRRQSAAAALVVAALVCPGPSSAQSADDAPPPPTVTRAGDPSSVLAAGETLRLTLSRPLTAGEGRVALVVGGTDVSGLVEVEGSAVIYRPVVEGLPRGDSEVQVFLVRPGAGEWQELGRLPLRVQVAPGVDRASFTPRVSFTGGGPLVTGAFPEAPPTDRDRYQDLTGQAELSSELVGGATSVRIEANLQGVSHRNDALRFRDLQEGAPRVDLSRYRIGIGAPGVNLQVGHVSAGTHPDLVRAFAARGAALRIEPAPRVDLSMAAMQGSGTVGWTPLLGLADPGHRLLTAQVGIDLVPPASGALRVEGVVLDGSRLPVSSFGRGEIRDRETSRGAGVLLRGSSPGQRLRVEASIARSRYETPPDAFVAPEVAALADPEATRGAMRLDAGAVLLRGVRLPGHLTGSLQVGYRWGRVDPLYRSVGSFVRPDLEEHALEFQGNAGPLSVRYTVERGYDNLDRIPSILRTRTDRNALNLSLPLRSLPRGAGSPGARSVLLPTVTYQFNQVHQAGVNDPVEGGFEPSHIPDQMNDVHNLALSWQAPRMRVGVRGGYSFQDNRQVGRVNDDFRNVTTAMSLGVSPWARLELSAEASREEAANLGLDRTDRTLSLDLGLTARPGWDTGLRVGFAPTRTRDREALRERSSSSLTGELSKRFRMGGVGGPSGNAFLRFARRTSHRLDLPLELEDRTRLWNLTSGFSLSLF